MLQASGDGVPPRPSGSDYPVHDQTRTATIAAARVPPAKVKSLFTSDVEKKYVVVETAIYPNSGVVIDVDAFDFVLLFGDDEQRHPDRPELVTSIWRERKDPLSSHGVHVYSETAVIYGRGTDPTTGRTRQGVETYEGVGVGVGDDPMPPPPPSSSKADPYAVEARLRLMMLPDGNTGIPVAGYLYFAKPKNVKNRNLKLRYCRDHDCVVLALPAK